ncbi:hypothetical protein [Agarivorans sp. 1_MG-2023]|uniref:hypothetical protein n=1 Tax=Agarivorans sp. 1_MG-2023 TaxID=3062634 RepID=UPI0026E15E5E|nr:hypothetical protein [Agarivorans sp. 1_MG-2023]MDO6762872.1 hypothetical protein [Agarivorans sp. 1_MG-2023]
MKKAIVFCLATLLFITCGVIGAAIGWSLRASVTLNQIPEYSYALLREVDSGDQEVDFTKVAAGDWTRVCFLGPYNENSSKALGFN